MAVALLLLWPMAAVQAQTMASLTSRIDAVIQQPQFAHAQWGIAVMSLDSGRTLYAHRAGRLLQPASTAKLYTAALGLATFGPAHRLSTRVLTDGILRNGRLQGSLVLRGGGDPALGTADDHPDWADQLAAQLSQRGVRRISGDLVADDRYFAGPAIGSGWEAGDMLASFAAPASALSVDENNVTVVVAPAVRAGEPARLQATPPEAMPDLVADIFTGPPRSASDVNLYRAPGSNTLYAFGTIPAGSSPQRYSLAMPDPAATAGQQLLQALSRHDIKLKGKLRVVHWPERDPAELDQAELDTAGLDHAGLNEAVVLAQLQSPPLIELLHAGLKRSENLYLQNLLLAVGVQAHAEAALQASAAPVGFLTTEAWSERALRQLLDLIGIPPAASALQEGTGLSRQDLTTPNALVRLLSFLAVQPYAAQLRDALPVAGEDGTLQYRMRDTAAAGNVHAKTGSMTYVNCLAGYVTTAGGAHLAFALMLNNFVRPEDAPPAHRALDAIAVLLAQDRSISPGAVVLPLHAGQRSAGTGALPGPAQSPSPGAGMSNTRRR